MKKVLNILVFIFAFALFRYLGLVGLLFLAAYYLGDWIAKWYCKRPKVNEKVLSFFLGQTLSRGYCHLLVFLTLV